MSELGERLDAIAGEDEWARHRALESIRESGATGAEILALRHQLAETDATRRVAARMALAALASPDSAAGVPALDELRAALTSDDPDVRVLAASALGEAGNPAAGPVLVEALEDPEANVAAAAADALGELGYTPALDALASLSRTGDFWLRAAAIVALGRLRDERAVPALGELAEESGLEKPLVEALRRIDHPDSLGPLEVLAARLPADALRAAGAVLASHPDVAAPDWVHAEARHQEESLRHELVDTDDPAIGRLLGYARTEAALQTLLDLAGPPRYSDAAIPGLLAVPGELRAELILERIGAADAREVTALLPLVPPLSRPDRIETLLPLLSHGRDEVRAAAAEALARSPASRALPLLAAELDRAEVAPEVVRAVGGLGETACAALIPLLSDPVTAVRAAAASALGRCAGEGLGPELRAVLADEEDPETRQALLRAVGRAGGAEGVEVLVDRLEHGSPEERLAAIEGLGAAGGSDAVAPLARALEGERSETIAALRSLGGIPGAEAAAAIARHLTSSDLDVRRAAARAAAAHGTGLDREAVEAMARDPDPWIRVCAARALARLEGAEDRLRRLADSDPDRDVRDAARAGLAGH